MAVLSIVGLLGACLEDFELGDWQREGYSEMLGMSVGWTMYDNSFHTIEQRI